jgi:hypothetical protein
MREMKGIYIYYILCVYIYTHYMIYMYINSYDFMVLPTVRSIFSNSASCGPRAELPKHQQRQEGRPSDFWTRIPRRPRCWAMNFRPLFCFSGLKIKHTRKPLNQ